jgi:hypothetical protein
MRKAEGVPGFRGTLAVWPEMDTGRETALKRRPRGNLKATRPLANEGPHISRQPNGLPVA